MEVRVLPGEAALGREAARRVAAAVAAKPGLVLGLAAGATPVPLYRELVRRHRAGLDLSRLTTFNLDEFCGLAAADPRSFRHFTALHLLDPIGLPAARRHAPDPAAPCAAYEAAIAAAGGIDLQILGIGRNGHIGFNEPGSDLASRTRRVALAPATIAASAAAFGSEAAVPREGVTLGIGTILAARRILLLASGAAKAPAVAAALEGPVTADVPASALQRHADVTVLLDAAAAACLAAAPPGRAAGAAR
jgi:glucosamine-6-phosphate deaminase